LDSKKTIQSSWSALVRYKDSSNSEQHCGGTLINSDFVLTSFSCLINGKDHELHPWDVWVSKPSMNPSDITVWMNFGNINPLDLEDKNIQVFPIEKIIINPNYIVNKLMKG
jgi:hypothetical protein